MEEIFNTQMYLFDIANRCALNGYVVVITIIDGHNVQHDFDIFLRFFFVISIASFQFGYKYHDRDVS